ncbi:MAG: STAS domain-containing protein, partial [Actinomycetota bacterium]
MSPLTSISRRTIDDGLTSRRSPFAFRLAVVAAMSTRTPLESMNSTPERSSVVVGWSARRAPSLDEAISARLADHPTTTLDLSGVEFMDSSGVRVLIAATTA